MNKMSLRFLAVFSAVLFLSSQVAYGQYCTPTYFQGCLTGVEINDFSITGDAGTSISDLATGCSSTGSFPPITSYRDMSASMSVTLTPGLTYTVTTDAATSDILPTGVQIFIDFNDDGTLDPPTESVGGGTMNLLGLSTSISITIPTGVASGSHRMRVVASGDLTYPSIIPCPSYSLTGGGTSLTGEVHDYTAVIGTTSGCPVPTGLAASSVTGTSATVSWTEPGSSAGSEYVVSTSPTAPTGSGTQTAGLVDNETGLTPGTVYYVWVRDSCDATDLSTWVMITFTTTATTSCPAVTGLSMSSVTSTTAVLNWSAATGSVGYLWAVTTSPSDPTSGWTFITLTTATASGLTPSTAYYAHVMDSCATNSSPWVATPFTTMVPTKVGNVSSGSDFSISTYPNPAGTELNVIVTGGENTGNLTLTDVEGKTILSQTIANALLKINLENVVAGLYLLRYTDPAHTEVMMVRKQ